MKLWKLMGVLALVGVLSAAAFGAAAALPVVSNPLQAGGDTNLVCDSDGVQVTWQDGWQPSPINDFGITGVAVGGISGSCDGFLVEVVLTGANGNYLASGSATIPPVGNAVPTSPLVKASDVLDVHVIIR